MVVNINSIKIVMLNRVSQNKTSDLQFFFHIQNLNQYYVLTWSYLLKESGLLPDDNMNFGMSIGDCFIPLQAAKHCPQVDAAQSPS